MWPSKSQYTIQGNELWSNSCKWQIWLNGDEEQSHATATNNRMVLHAYNCITIVQLQPSARHEALYCRVRHNDNKYNKVTDGWSGGFQWDYYVSLIVNTQSLNCFRDHKHPITEPGFLDCEHPITEPCLLDCEHPNHWTVFPWLWTPKSLNRVFLTVNTESLNLVSLIVNTQITEPWPPKSLNHVSLIVTTQITEPHFLDFEHPNHWTVYPWFWTPKSEPCFLAVHACVLTADLESILFHCWLYVHTLVLTADYVCSPLMWFAYIYIYVCVHCRICVHTSVP